MEQDDISDIVFGVVHSYRLAMRATLKASELGLNSMHVRCLSFIERNQRCTANDIVQFLARDKAQVARLIKEMIDKEWLTKSANPEDRRSQFLALTTDGIKLASLIRDTQLDIHNTMLENLSAEQVKAFKTVAGTMAANLRSYGKDI
ncbi:MarR family winged helix-turn-helix transcriptional regulator [Agarivorans sp. MS3-6]